MATLSVSYSIDGNDHLIADIPGGVGTLTVENGLAGASQQYDPFFGSVDLGAATAGVYAFLLSLGADTAAATVAIVGVAGMFSLVYGVPKGASDGALGFDTDTSLGDAQISVLKQNFNYTFCLRYVARSVSSPAKDISPAEVGWLLAADVSLMVVQHPPASPWAPTANLGTTWGAAAAANAFNASLAKGITLFCDLEDVDPATDPSDTTDFCNSWFASVAAAGYVAGLYVGANCGLTDAQLSALNAPVFWKSCSNVPAPAQGFSMTQGPCDVGRGDATLTVNVDENTINTASPYLFWLKKQ